RPLVAQPAGQPIHGGGLQAAAVATRAVPAAEAVTLRGQLADQVAAQETRRPGDGDQHGRHLRRTAAPTPRPLYPQASLAPPARKSGPAWRSLDEGGMLRPLCDPATGAGFVGSFSKSRIPARWHKAGKIKCLGTQRGRLASGTGIAEKSEWDDCSPKRIRQSRPPGVT